MPALSLYVHIYFYVKSLTLTYADVCWRMLAYAGVCWRMLAYAGVHIFFTLLCVSSYYFYIVLIKDRCSNLYTQYGKWSWGSGEYGLKSLLVVIMV
jgi:hypothetical protein